MSGCFGNSQEDRYYENQLINYLADTNYRTGTFTSLEINLETSDDHFCIELDAELNEDFIQKIHYREFKIFDQEKETFLVIKDEELITELKKIDIDELIINQIEFLGD